MTASMAYARSRGVGWLVYGYLFVFQVNTFQVICYVEHMTCIRRSFFGAEKIRNNFAIPYPCYM